VASEIKKIKCGGRASGEPEKYSFEGKTFAFTIVEDGFNAHDIEWLNRHLGGGKLGDAKGFAEAEKYLALKTTDMNSKCESSIKAVIDRPSFIGKGPRDLTPRECDRMAYVLGEGCGDEAHRKKVLKVKTLTCRWADTPESHFSEYKNGNLVWGLGKGGGIDSHASNLEADALIK
jgi:hypothetical protein